MATGTVKKLAQERGFGFIEAVSGPDIFFHHTVVADRQFDNLVVGQLVDYAIDSASQTKGPRAKSVIACRSMRAAA